MFELILVFVFLLVFSLVSVLVCVFVFVFLLELLLELVLVFVSSLGLSSVVTTFVFITGSSASMSFLIPCTVEFSSFFSVLVLEDFTSLPLCSLHKSGVVNLKKYSVYVLVHPVRAFKPVSAQTVTA